MRTATGTLIKGVDLETILRNHRHWRSRDINGWETMRANLSDVDLTNVDLRWETLRWLDLRWAKLEGANLLGADLSNADLYGANLVNANLSHANLRDANLYGADLRGADLCGVKLSGANLREAALSGAVNVPYIPMVCPEEGKFIGWKKVRDKIIKLEIPSNAKRSSATSRKCRCEFAKVLYIFELDGKPSNITKITNYQYEECVYEIGKYVYPDCFNEDRWIECSHGIHFFMQRQEAINY